MNSVSAPHCRMQNRTPETFQEVCAESGLTLFRIQCEPGVTAILQKYRRAALTAHVALTNQTPRHVACDWRLKMMHCNIPLGLVLTDFAGVDPNQTTRLQTDLLLLQ